MLDLWLPVNCRNERKLKSRSCHSANFVQMPLLAADEIEAYLVKWAENIKESIPAAANTILIQWPKVWDETGF